MKRKNRENRELLQHEKGTESFKETKQCLEMKKIQ